jgi:hypothetical protein
MYAIVANVVTPPRISRRGELPRVEPAVEEIHHEITSPQLFV